MENLEPQYDLTKVQKVLPSQQIERLIADRRKFTQKFKESTQNEKSLIKILETDENILEEMKKSNKLNKDVETLKCNITDSIKKHYEFSYKKFPTSLEMWRRYFEFLKKYKKQEVPENLEPFLESFMNEKLHSEKYYLLLTDILKLKIEILQSSCIKTERVTGRHVKIETKTFSYVKPEQNMEGKPENVVKQEENVEVKTSDQVKQEGEPYVKLESPDISPTKAEENLIKTFQEGLYMHKESVLLWTAYLKFHISNGDLEKSNQVFDEAIKVFPNYKGLPFWRLMIQFYEIILESYSVMELMKRAIQEGDSTISKHFLSVILEYANNYKGIKFCRKMYEILQEKSRKSLEMHYTMADMEKNLGTDNADNIRVCYENTTKQFGNLAEVWLKYIEFEDILKNTVKVEELYRKANSELTDKQLEKFKEEFPRLNISCVPELMQSKDS